jgi:hypothetical protein
MIAENIFTGKLFDDVDSVDLQYTEESIIMKHGLSRRSRRIDDKYFFATTARHVLKV